MFDITKEVPSLELCKKLKELGYPQEGEGEFWEGFWWVRSFMQDWEVSYGMRAGWAKGNEEKYIKAPTCRELGEWLPVEVEENHYHIKFSQGRDNNNYIYWYEDRNDNTLDNFYAISNTEANARAKMLIWLVEKGYVNFRRDEKTKKTKKLKICKNCRWWKPEYLNYIKFKVGRCCCPKIHYGQEQDMKEPDECVYCDFEDYSAKLVTGENFGCIHFLPKNKKLKEV